MELVDGRELKEHFAADERFRSTDIERIMTQILAALEYSHRRGVVHRDIKPANVFLLADGTVKVTDFGIAHIESSNLTQVGTVVGTPNYMSPEQIMGLPVDGRSDLFSAGVILYQFLTGERPFAGSSTTTMQKVLKEEPLPPSTLNVQLPPAIDAVVRRALAKRADDRFPTAQAFADALHAAMPAPMHDCRRCRRNDAERRFRCASTGGGSAPAPTPADVIDTSGRRIRRGPPAARNAGARSREAIADSGDLVCRRHRSRRSRSVGGHLVAVAARCRELRGRHRTNGSDGACRGRGRSSCCQPRKHRRACRGQHAAGRCRETRRRDRGRYTTRSSRRRTPARQSRHLGGGPR
jgi:hypothetical protein